MLHNGIPTIIDVPILTGGRNQQIPTKLKFDNFTMAHSVYWHDGMFFWPHHMQTEQRFQQLQLVRGQKWNMHYNWGLRSLTIDPDALLDQQLVIKSLQLRMRDGSLIDLADIGALSALDLTPFFARTDAVTVSLAVPVMRPGRENVNPPPSEDANGEAEPTEEPSKTADEDKSRFRRYSAATAEIEDENANGNAQSIAVRHFNVRLLAGATSVDGYETMPLARIKRFDSAEGGLELDPTYIPPVLTCDAWKGLQVDVLQVSYNRIGEKQDRLGGEVVSRGINFDTKHSGAARRIAQLQILNEANAVLNNLAFVDGIHPLWAYTELCRIVGKLAVLGAEKLVPALPRYDHDDLGGCFFAVKRFLEALLEEVVEPNYVVRPFVGEGLHMQVSLEQDWLRSVWQIFVGVRSSLDPQVCARMLTRSNQLDMKIGSSTRVDEIFDRGEQGLKFTQTSQVPQTLPSEPGLIYFQVARESNRDEWGNVEKALALAIRLNQNRIEGDFQGKNSVTVKIDNERNTLGFALYLVNEQQT